MMDKRILIIMTVLLVLLLVVGCNQTPTTKTDDMANETNDEMMNEDMDNNMDNNMDNDMNNNIDNDMDNDMNNDMDEDMIGMVTEAGYIDISPEEAKMLIDSDLDLVVIDVSPKYDSGHLPGAINYYVGNGSLDAAIPDLDMDKAYLVYCHADSPAISGATKLVDAGFDPVYRLVGNYSAWVDAGYPIEK